MSIQFSQHISKDSVFVISRSEIEGRLDPSVYKTSFKYVSQLYPNVRLSEIAYINPTTSFSEFCEEDLISFIPMENIDEVNGDIVSYDVKTVKESKGYTRFQENDLLWAKIAPCMQNGKSAIAYNLSNGVGCGSTEFFVIRPKSNVVKIEYIHYLLHSSKVLETAKNYFSGAAGQQRVSISFLKNFNTPLPPIEIQENIVDIISEAKKQKKQYEQLSRIALESIDEYLLSELGIQNDVKTIDSSQINMRFNRANPLVQRGTFFLIQYGDISGSRLDPIYYNSDITKFTNCTYSERLSNLANSFDNGFAVGRQDQVEEGNGVLQIRPTNIDNNGRLRFEKNVYVPEVEDVPFIDSGVVLFNNTNSQEWVGKTSYFANEENRKVYTSNHITAIEVDRSKILPEYLCAILNMYQRHKVFYSICTNWNNQSGIGLELLRSLHIPLFTADRKESLRRQQQVVDRINVLYQEADECISSANRIMNEAKVKVESMIMQKQ